MAARTEDTVLGGETEPEEGEKKKINKIPR